MRMKRDGPRCTFYVNSRKKKTGVARTAQIPI